MAVNLSPVGGVAAQFFDNSGNPLTGGKLYTYSAGTTTPAVTYTSSSGATAHTNPIVLDAAGRVPNSGEVWLTDGLQYKFVLKTSTDTLLATYDNIVGINSNFVNFTNEQEIQTATAGQTVFTLTTMQYQPGTTSLSVFVDGVNQYGPGAQYAYLETDSTTVTFISGLHVGAEVKFTTSAINASSYGDAFQISYTPPFTGSAATNVGDKLAQTVSVMDFGAVGDGATDDSDAIQAAFDVGGLIEFPFANYVCGKDVTITKDIEIVGNGSNVTFSSGYLKAEGTKTGSTYTLTADTLLGSTEFNVSGGSFLTTNLFQVVDIASNSFSKHNVGYKKGQLFDITEVNTNQIIVGSAAVASWDYTVPTVEVRKISPIKVVIRDLNVASATGDYVASITYGQACVVDNCSFVGGVYGSLKIDQTKKANIKDTFASCTEAAAGYQYGIVISDSEDVTIDKCNAYGTRHGIAIGGGSNGGCKYILIKNCDIASDATINLYSADIHGSASYVTYKDNNIYGGAVIAGEYASYINNNIYSKGGASSNYPVFNMDEIVGGEFTIQNNRLIASLTNASTAIVQSTSSSTVSKIDYSYTLTFDNNETFCNPSIEQFVVLNTHGDATGVTFSASFTGTKFRGDCSSFIRYVRLASIIGAGYIAPKAVLINDFNMHSTMSSSVKVFEITSGIMTDAVLKLPQFGLTVELELLSGEYRKVVTRYFPWDYGDYVPSVSASIINSDLQNPFYCFTETSTISTASNIVVTTGNVSNTVSSNYTYKVSALYGGHEMIVS